MVVALARVLLVLRPFGFARSWDGVSFCDDGAGGGLSPNLQLRHPTPFLPLTLSTVLKNESACMARPLSWITVISQEGGCMLDYSFWNDPEVAAARAEVISAAVAFEAGNGEEPALERAVTLFNEVVDQVRTRLGHYKDEPDAGYKLTEDEHRMVFERRLDEIKVPPPQTEVLGAARKRLLEAARNLDKPMAKWEREFLFNTACMHYELKALQARDPVKKEGRECRGIIPMSNTNTSISISSAGS